MENAHIIYHILFSPHTLLTTVLTVLTFELRRSAAVDAVLKGFELHSQHTTSLTLN